MASDDARHPIITTPVFLSAAHAQFAQALGDPGVAAARIDSELRSDALAFRGQSPDGKTTYTALPDGYTLERCHITRNIITCVKTAPQPAAPPLRREPWIERRTWFERDERSTESRPKITSRVVICSVKVWHAIGASDEKSRGGSPGIWNWEGLVPLLRDVKEPFESRTTFEEWCGDNVQRKDTRLRRNNPDVTTVRRAIRKHQLDKIAGVT